MALAATGIAAISAIGGLLASFRWDTPTGPTIVCIAALIFAICTAATRIFDRSN
ncbi:MAG: metal ABC transporter permease [Paracoccaceae bacterium]